MLTGEAAQGGNGRRQGFLTGAPMRSHFPLFSTRYFSKEIRASKVFQSQKGPKKIIGFMESPDHCTNRRGKEPSRSPEFRFGVGRGEAALTALA